jgi:intracellular sulfur oxidation DsrE/DsrF family protein
LSEVAPVPDTIIFFNSGVKLVVEGSPVLEDLQALSEHGIEILVCGTCLGYYEIVDQLAVGEVSNMYTIAETMLGAGKVVQL